MIGVDKLLALIDLEPEKHPGCKGFSEWTDWGYEYDCGYDTDLVCEDCKYGGGRKDPAAKCNAL